MVDKNKGKSERETNEKTIRPKRKDEGKEYKKETTEQQAAEREGQKGRTY